MKAPWVSCGASRISAVSPRLTQQLAGSAKSIVRDQRCSQFPPYDTVMGLKIEDYMTYRLVV